MLQLDGQISDGIKRDVKDLMVRFGIHRVRERKRILVGERERYEMGDLAMSSGYRWLTV